VTDREAAWSAILDQLPPRWRVSQPSYAPATRSWSVVAIGTKLGGRHGPPPEIVIGTGDDELAALVDLARQLGG
jgi:hypothetical protein